MAPRGNRQRSQTFPIPLEVNEFCRIVAQILRRGSQRSRPAQDSEESAVNTQDFRGHQGSNGSNNSIAKDHPL